MSQSKEDLTTVYYGDLPSQTFISEKPKTISNKPKIYASKKIFHIPNQTAMYNLKPVVAPTLNSLYHLQSYNLGYFSLSNTLIECLQWSSNVTEANMKYSKIMSIFQQVGIGDINFIGAFLVNHCPNISSINFDSSK